MSWYKKETNLESKAPNRLENGSNTPYVQVPSSSPINVHSSPQKQEVEVMPPSRVILQQAKHNDFIDQERERRLEAKRQAIRNHKDYPMVRKSFYYLDESAIFKGFVKGKGNLRDVTQWLSENYNKSEILNMKEKEMKKLQMMNEAKNEQAKFKFEIGQRQNSMTNQNTQENSEDSPIIMKGRARTKPSIEDDSPKKNLAVHNIDSTNVSKNKPKISILDKYKFQPSTGSMKQSRLDGLFGSNKKRKLVRGSAFDSSASDTSEATTPTAFPPDMPTLAAEPDLDELEKNIRANKRLSRIRRTRGKTLNLDDDDEDDDEEDEEDNDVELVEEEDDDDAEEEVHMDDDDFKTGYTTIDNQIIDFLNEASESDIIEVCSVTPNIAQLIKDKRPYTNIYEVIQETFEDTSKVQEEDGSKKRKNRLKKPLGQKIVESTEACLKGYKAVDSLIKKCSEYGDLITQQIKKWGVDVSGSGELEVVDLDSGGDNEDEDAVKIVRRKEDYIKNKPSLLADDVILKNYQQVGINWLYLLYKHKLSCILADEMGLGKTCQVISFMALLKEKETEGPHLVVVPASTLENWLREFQKFCPGLRVQAYYGSQAQREDLRYELQDVQFDVMVTTYNLATGSSADFKFLRQQKFNVIVYDEGHMLKNSGSERYAKLMRLKANFRLLLTGTPLQNNLKELVSLLAFMLPQLFINKKEDLDGLFNQKVSTTDTNKDYNPLLTQQAIAKARTMMTPFVLRRKKSQVLKHLPAKIHQIEKCELTDKQKSIYFDHLKKGKEARAERIRRSTLSAKELSKANKENPMPTSSNVMMVLRKASLHPLLFRTLYDDKKLQKMAKEIRREPEYVEANEQYIYEDMCVMSDYELDRLCKQFPHTMSKYILDKKHWYESGKITKLLEIIDAIINKKEKILVFSLFTQMLDILEVVLSFENIKFLRLDGQTSVESRQDIIDQFYEDDSIPVFLLSTKAGGFGINLVVSNNVVIFDQSFNPHDDRQAEDRAHRVGQNKEVYVKKLITKDTIEESMLQLAQNKLALDQSISSEEGNEKQIEEKAAKFFEKVLFD